MALAGSFASSTAPVDINDCLHQEKPLRLVRDVGGGRGKQNRKNNVLSAFVKHSILEVTYGLYRRVIMSIIMTVE